MSFTDLWSEASRDVAAENHTKVMEMAKHASRGVWTFLAQAEGDVEYRDRLELARDNIESVASSTGAPLDGLLEVFDQRFALLMEAKGNPFGDDDSDDDDTDEDGDGSTDDDGDDGDSGDETDSGGDDDNSDDSDTSEDGDTDSDKDSDDDGDDDDTDDDGSDGSPPFPPKSSARYASLLARIEAGENPLSWGGTPFAPSSVRTAAGATDDVVSDENVPNETTPADGLMGVPGPMLPETTKPRQTPEGDGMMPGMGMGEEIAGEQPMDPALNGGDVGAGADTPPDTQREAKVAAIASDVQQHNPHLSAKQCRRVALQVVARYFKQAEDLSPLLYGDRGNVQDGPFTEKAKSWQPPDPKKLKAPSAPGGAAPAAAEGAGAAEGLAGLAEGAEALAPLLLL